MANTPVTLYAGTHDQLVFIASTDATAIDSTRDAIFASGQNDFVVLEDGSSNISVVDAGKAMTLDLLGATGITVYDFNRDHLGKVELAKEITPPTLTSDHHGGTYLATSDGTASAHFVGASVADVKASILLAPH